jgi:hypothetical protein
MVVRVRDLASEVLVNQLVLPMQGSETDDVERLVTGFIDERFGPGDQPMVVIGVPVDRFVNYLAEIWPVGST